MKTLKIGAFAILGLLAVACNDDDDNTTKLSSQEQAEMVASSIGRSGFSRSAEQAGDYADDNDAARVNAECGVEISNDWDLSGELGKVFLSFIIQTSRFCLPAPVISRKAWMWIFSTPDRIPVLALNHHIQVKEI